MSVVALAMDDPDDNELSRLDNAELRKRLADGLRMTVRGLTLAAAAWRELERRGEDLSELRVGINRIIPLIAAGQIHPDAAVEIGLASPGRLKHLRGLPLQRQAELAAKAKVRVWDAAAGEVKEMEVLHIPEVLMSTIFTDGIERTPEQQRLVIRLPRQRAARKVKFDRKSQTVTIGNTSAPLPAVLAAIAEVSGWQGKLDWDEHSLRQGPVEPCQMTEAEQKRLRDVSKVADLSPSEFLRRAMLAWLA